jgi:hypothetical protein
MKERKWLEVSMVAVIIEVSMVAVITSALTIAG